MGGIAADKAFLADKVFLNEEVSVIIPTYKEGRVLAETKRGFSVLNQPSILLSGSKHADHKNNELCTGQIRRGEDRAAGH
jgi:hypothetical protein